MSASRVTCRDEVEWATHLSPCPPHGHIHIPGISGHFQLWLAWGHGMAGLNPNFDPTYSWNAYPYLLPNAADPQAPPARPLSGTSATTPN